jgi:hypothetical protein
MPKKGARQPFSLRYVWANGIKGSIPNYDQAEAELRRDEMLRFATARETTVTITIVNRDNKETVWTNAGSEPAPQPDRPREEPAMPEQSETAQAVAGAVEPEQYVAGYMGQMFAEDVEDEKAKLEKWSGLKVDRWFIDMADEGNAGFEHLASEIAEFKVRSVVHRGPAFMPEDRELLAALFDAAADTDTNVVAAEGIVMAPRPEQKLLAQLMPLLHEWSNGETELMGRMGHHTLYFSTAEVEHLRELYSRDGSPTSLRLLDRLPEFESDGEE